MLQKMRPENDSPFVCCSDELYRLKTFSPNIHRMGGGWLHCVLIGDQSVASIKPNHLFQGLSRSEGDVLPAETMQGVAGEYGRFRSKSGKPPERRQRALPQEIVRYAWFRCGRIATLRSRTRPVPGAGDTLRSRAGRRVQRSSTVSSPGPTSRSFANKNTDDPADRVTPRPAAMLDAKSAAMPIATAQLIWTRPSQDGGLQPNRAMRMDGGSDREGDQGHCCCGMRRPPQ